MRPPIAYARVGAGPPVHLEWLARTLSAWIPGSRLALVPGKVPDRDNHLHTVRATIAGELAGHA